MNTLIISAALTALAAVFFILWRRCRYCQALLDDMSEAALVTDAGRNILYANGAAHEMLGLKAGSLSGLKCHKAVHGLEKQPPECAAAKSGEKCRVGIEHFSPKIGKDMLIDVYPLTGGKRLCIAREADPKKTRETKLYHKAQIEAMSRLSGAVAHQFNNILSVISAALHLAKSARSGETGRDEALGAIGAAVKNAASITRQLLTLGRGNPLRKVRLDIRDTILETLKIFSSQPGAPAVETRFNGELPAIQGDPLEISRLLQYILGNREFLSPSGEPVIIEASPAALSNPARSDGEESFFIRISVSRLCINFDKDSVQGIFEPGLETTRWTLPLAYAIARNHGGWLEASYSWEGVLSFEFYLPAGKPAAVEPLPPTPEKAAPEKNGGPLRILLAEDDEDLRLMTAKMLETEGHQVTQAADGLEAERLLASGNFDALVSDVLMPGKSGPEVADAAAAKKPSIRVILMSGHSDGRLDTEKTAAKGYIFLQKPYSAEKLLSLLK